jgi:DNA-binding LacI/PurR family transcriptional regulator
MNPASDSPHPLPQRLSLVTQTVRSLREGIRAGTWRDTLPGERELCERLNVSRNTLRVALKELERSGWLETSQGCRRRINAKEVRNRLNTAKQVIGVLSAWHYPALSPMLTLVMDEVRDRLAKAGCAVEFHCNPSCFSAKPGPALQQVVAANSAAAWLIVGSKEPTQRWFIRQRIPCLVSGSCKQGIALASVDMDNGAICRHAGAVLMRKGRHRLALVLPPGAFDGDSDSETGLREALRSHPRSRLRVLRHNGTAPHLCRLLDEALRLPEPPSAFIVAHPERVFTVMTHLMRRGKRIPQDVAIISRDDHPFFSSTSPAIAHYHVDTARFARRIAQAICQLAETGSLPPRAIRLMPEFIAGETV